MMDWQLLFACLIGSVLAAWVVLCIGTGIAWLIDGLFIIPEELWREWKRRGGHF